MKLNWIIISAISGLLGGLITYALTRNWKIALVSAVVVFVFVVLSNPKRRYMKAFYTVLFPLITNVYFTIHSTTENFDIQAGLKNLNAFTVVALGLICVICLILDYLERGGKLKEGLISINKNANKNVSGTNININQTINKEDPATND